MIHLTDGEPRSTWRWRVEMLIRQPSTLALDADDKPVRRADIPRPLAEGDAMSGSLVAAGVTPRPTGARRISPIMLEERDRADTFIGRPPAGQTVAA